MKKQLSISVMLIMVILVSVIYTPLNNVYATEESTVESEIEESSNTDMEETLESEIEELLDISIKETGECADNNVEAIGKMVSSQVKDSLKPNVSAAVSNGYLNVKAIDNSGIESVYVNGNEFTDIKDGALKIRLQQYDASYQQFEVKAKDVEGNVSDTYTTSNPYYVSKDTSSNDKADLLAQLPISAVRTPVTSATAIVTEHVKTNANGNEITPKQTFSEENGNTTSKTKVSDTENNEEYVENTEKGKEFYTIQADTGKTFYLVIDRDGEEEKVYFLTEINENDLLHVTEDNSEVLPQNNAIVEASVPTSVDKYINEEAEKTTETAETEVVEDEKPVESKKTNNTNLIIIVVAVIGGVILYYFKVVKKKDQGFIEEDEDEEDEEEEDYTESEEEDFFRE